MQPVHDSVEDFFQFIRYGPAEALATMWRWADQCTPEITATALYRENVVPDTRGILMEKMTGARSTEDNREVGRPERSTTESDV